ncbi:MAG: hypothetical protein IJ365_08580 [Clostridia bacterium]|nr:hypothetical protein [Clostridia bacterium]
MNKLSKFQKALICAIAVGILLMVISFEPANTDVNNDTYADSTQLELKIAQLIKKTYSLKEVSVILTYDTNGEKITSADYDDSDGGGDGFVFSTENTKPFVVSEKLPYVRGALISASDISSEESAEIQKAVATLLGISTSKVDVIYSN